MNLFGNENSSALEVTLMEVQKTIDQVSYLKRENPQLDYLECIEIIKVCERRATKELQNINAENTIDALRDIAERLEEISKVINQS